MDQAIKDIAQMIGASEQTVKHAAEGCARRLIEWYGDEDKAYQAMQADPLSNMEIAISDYTSTIRKMAVKALTHPDDYVALIYQMVQERQTLDASTT